MPPGKFFPGFSRQNKNTQRPHNRCVLSFTVALYFSTAPWLALVTSRAYRASQPDFTLGSGWT